MGAGNVAGVPTGPADGYLHWATHDTTAGLHVASAVVVDCWPPAVAEWAIDRDARELWRHGRRTGATLVWVSAGQVIEERRSLIGVDYRRTVARWGHTGAPWAQVHVSLGWHPDGRWWADDTEERAGWLFIGLGAEDRARQLAAEWMAAPRRAPGTWAEVIAEYEPSAVARAALPAPPRPPSYREPTGGLPSESDRAGSG